MVPRNLALQLDFSLLALRTDKDSRRTRELKSATLIGSFSANQHKHSSARRPPDRRSDALVWLGVRGTAASRRQFRTASVMISVIPREAGRRARLALLPVQRLLDDHFFHAGDHPVAGCRQVIDVIAPTPRAKPVDTGLLRYPPVVRSWLRPSRPPSARTKSTLRLLVRRTGWDGRAERRLQQRMKGGGMPHRGRSAV
jgi:hypothetical protein